MNSKRDRPMSPAEETEERASELRNQLQIAATLNINIENTNRDVRVRLPQVEDAEGFRRALDACYIVGVTDALVHRPGLASALSAELAALRGWPLDRLATLPPRGE